ncbi:MAG: hypothetical protein II576_11260 [Prevotella sp.]|jgi:hypothetical protein|nr:hypothetical protein [Prevotella sp.]MBQ2589819.1 hypothetical protein [Prevotella sp.]
MKENKPYPQMDEEDNSTLNAKDAVYAITEMKETVIPDDLDYAHVVDGKLQVTPDIEEEIAEVERGETVSLDEFKSMFSRWLD